MCMQVMLNKQEECERLLAAGADPFAEAEVNCPIHFLHTRLINHQFMHLVGSIEARISRQTAHIYKAVCFTR